MDESGSSGASNSDTLAITVHPRREPASPRQAEELVGQGERNTVSYRGHHLEELAEESAAAGRFPTSDTIGTSTPLVRVPQGGGGLTRLVTTSESPIPIAGVHLLHIHARP